MRCLRVILGVQIHGRVLESRDIIGELSHEFCRQLSFFSNTGGEFTSIILHILKYIKNLEVEPIAHENDLDMRLDFCPKLFQMLYD